MQSIQQRNHSISSTESGKLMSISSIISNAAHKENMERRRVSAPVYHPYNRSDHHHHHHHQQQVEEEYDINSPLTLQERRLRNKAASAKYRQKKNQQQNEMQMMITHLSEQNLILERQLEELRAENDRLKSTADKLRGNIVAKKMLKKWIGTSSNKMKEDSFKNWSDDDDEDDELDSISSS